MKNKKSTKTASFSVFAQTTHVVVSNLTSVCGRTFLCSVFDKHRFRSFAAPMCRTSTFCRTMLYISATYAVVRCLSVCLAVSVSVCLSRSCILSKRVNSKHIFKMFPPSGSSSNAILVFSVPNVTAIFGRGPPNEGFECRWGSQKIAILDQYMASSHVVNGATAKCYTHSCAGPW